MYLSLFVFTVLRKQNSNWTVCLMYLILYCTYRSFPREENVVNEQDVGLGV